MTCCVLTNISHILCSSPFCWVTAIQFFARWKQPSWVFTMVTTQNFCLLTISLIIILLNSLVTRFNNTPGHGVVTKSTYMAYLSLVSNSQTAFSSLFVVAEKSLVTFHGISCNGIAKFSLINVFNNCKWHHITRPCW